MVFLNYSTMQMVAKIVYYGPGLGGKTTNLKTIYKNTDERSRGEMVSLATETDRTLFFDLLPMEVGVIGGFKTKFQLYTVPGQVFYNTTRKLVLRGVDGIVFVADSQTPMMDANKESFLNLKENLAELNLTVDDVPLVLQYNKRDLPNVAPIEEMNRLLNPTNLPYVEAAALNGVGVFETLREVSKQTLLILNKKSHGNQLTDEKPKKEAAPPPPQPPSAPALDDNESLAELTDPDAGDQDNFEETLESMELDFDDDDDLDADLSDIESWDETDDSLKEVMLDESSMTPTLDDSVPEMKVKESKAEVSEEAKAMAGAYLEDMSGTEDDMDPFDFDTPAAEPPSSPAIDDSLGGDDPEPDLDMEPLPEPGFVPEAEEALPSLTVSPMDDDLELIDDVDALEGLESLDEFAPIDDVVEEVRTTAVEPEPEPAPMMEAEELELVDDLDMEDLDAEPEADPILTSDLPEPEPEPLAPPEPKPAPEQPRGKSPADIDASLADLKTMTTRMSTRNLGMKKKKPKASVDDLLTGLSVDKKTGKMERKSIKVKTPFDHAQLNCVFLDAGENVVDTHLLKVETHDLGGGRRRIKVSIDIEIDDSGS